MASRRWPTLVFGRAVDPRSRPPRGDHARHRPLGPLGAAEHHLARGLERAARIDNDPLRAQALQQLGLARIRAGRLDDSVPLLARAAEALRRGRLQADAAHCLEEAAAVAHARARDEAAARALAVAAAVRARLGVPAWPTVRELVSDLAREVHQRLGSSVASRLAEEAAHRDPFDALEEALAAAGVR